MLALVAFFTLRWYKEAGMNAMHTGFCAAGMWPLGVPKVKYRGCVGLMSRPLHLLREEVPKAVQWTSVVRESPRSETPRDPRIEWLLGKIEHDCLHTRGSLYFERVHRISEDNMLANSYL
jgi:hypothetical protein